MIRAFHGGWLRGNETKVDGVHFLDGGPVIQGVASPWKGEVLGLSREGKAAFDLTQGRSWKLKNAAFSIRRGSSAEILDVRPARLDGNFAAYFSGSNGRVAPWGACAMRGYVDATTGRWMQIDTKAQLKRIERLQNL